MKLVESSHRISWMMIKIRDLLQECYSDYNAQHRVEILAERYELHVPASSLTHIQRVA